MITRNTLRFPDDYPLFSGMETVGEQDEYAEFLVQAITADVETIEEEVDALAGQVDVNILYQVQQHLEALAKELRTLRQR